MYILEVTCSDPALQNVLYVVRRVVNIIQIVVPILLMIALCLQIFTLVTNPDDKKAKGKIKNSIIAAIIVFFVPFIVNVVMGLIDEKTVVSDCWNKATTKASTRTQYQDPNGYGSNVQKNNNNKRTPNYERGKP